jgi:uncharacterized protein YggE
MKRLLLMLVSLPWCVLADGGLPNQPYIYVEGRAEIERPADLVTLRFEIAGRNLEQAKANEQVQAHAAKIFALLNDRKIAGKDIIAGDLRSEAEYEGDEDSPPKRRTFIGYVVTRPFAVKVRDVAVFPKVVDELLAIGVANFSGIEAGLTDEKKLEDQAWEKALTNAGERAGKTLKAAGMKIDSIFAISPVTFPEIRQKIFGSEYEGAASYAAAEGAPKVNPSQYRLAPVSVSERVHVIYLISPAK